MTSESKTVDHIARTHLCIQCGTCAAACPTDAITIGEFRKTGLIYPVIDNELCIDCGLCYDVCPVNEFSLYTEPVDDFKRIGIVAAKSDDKEQISSSGGAVSTILKFLFSKGRIDKAVVAVRQQGKILEPHGMIITSEKEVDQARGSIYQPIALNEVLKQVSSKDKIAFVGLPCHIKGLVKYIEEAKKIKSANVYKIGIFCNIGRSRNATRFLIGKYSKKEKGIIRDIHYRKGEYPGYMSLEYDSGSIEVEYRDYMTRIGYFFTPRGCLFCDDLFNEEADISVGDPWGLVDSKKALVIARSVEGEKIVEEMLKRGIFNLDRDLSREEAINTQNYKHKKNRAVRASLYSKIGIVIPQKIKSELPTYKDRKVTLFNTFLSLVLLFNSFLFNSRFYKLASIFPSKLLSKMSTLVKAKYKSGSKDQSAG